MFRFVVTVVSPPSRIASAPFALPANPLRQAARMYTAGP